MMNRPIEGIVVAATLRGSLLGQSFWRDVVIRRSDGGEIAFARLVTSARMNDVLRAGSRGRFYVHNLGGGDGLHAFAPIVGAQFEGFPRLAEQAFAALAVLNLGLAALWLGFAGLLSPAALTGGALATAIWAACLGARQAIIHDMRFDTSVEARRTHRAAVMHSHA